MVLSEIRPSPSRLHYAWVIVGVTFLVAIVTAGVRATPGVMIVPLEAEFGWSRATISLALGINLLLFGAIGPFAAAVMDRFGAPIHDRQMVIPERSDWSARLELAGNEIELLRALPAGSLEVEQVR